MITHNGKQVTLAMRNRKPISLIARNGKAMFGEYGDIAYTAIDKAAKAVILAEYGSVVWIDVKQYAKAHPQIVEFINQDPHLACSISPNSNKERWLVGDGKAYINTGVKGNNPIDIQIDVMFESFTSSFSVLSARKSNYRFYACYIDSQKWCVPNGTDFSVVGSPVAKKSYRINTSFKSGAFTLAENGTQLYKGGGVTNTDLDLYLFARKYNNSIDSFAPSGTKAGRCILGTQKDLIPHLTADGQCGMLDLVTYTFHPNANTQGTFTIAVTDKE